MSAEDLEKYETEMELKLYREYRDVVGLFKYVIETERRFYLTNDYEMQVHSVQGEVFFEVSMADAWVWDMYRPARFVKQVRVLTFKDVNIEELNKSDSRSCRAAERSRPVSGGSRPAHSRVAELSTAGELSTKIHQVAGSRRRVTVGAGGGADMNATRSTRAGTARIWRRGGWPRPG